MLYPKFPLLQGLRNLFILEFTAYPFSKFNHFLPSNVHESSSLAEGLTVLSLCDGMSCGHIALEEAGFKVKTYFAAEIKDFAIRVTKENYPDTIHIGDVNKITYKDGVLYTGEGNFETKIDVVMFGSPCQSFSRAMKADMRVGLEDMERSGLFLECNRILKEVNPKYFLMENVVMKAEDEEVITKMMGVNLLESTLL